MKIQFSAAMDSNTLDYQNGEYSRRFDRREQPFEATPEEWAGLERTGYFEPVKEEPPAQDENPPAAQADGQSATTAPQKSCAKNRAAKQQPAEENLNDGLPNS